MEFWRESSVLGAQIRSTKQIPSLKTQSEVLIAGDLPKASPVELKRERAGERDTHLGGLVKRADLSFLVLGDH